MKIEYTEGNAAFTDNPFEHSRILRKIADQVDEGREHGVIHDYNGNRIGEWSMDEEEES